MNFFSVIAEGKSKDNCHSLRKNPASLHESYGSATRRRFVTRSCTAKAGAQNSIWAVWYVLAQPRYIRRLGQRDNRCKYWVLGATTFIDFLPAVIFKETTLCGFFLSFFLFSFFLFSFFFFFQWCENLVTAYHRPDPLLHRYFTQDGRLSIRVNEPTRSKPLSLAKIMGWP
jgi:hypothetical protein